MVILPQCAGFLKSHGIKAWSAATTPALRARGEAGDPSRAAPGELAAEIYGLEVLVPQIEDQRRTPPAFW